MKIIFFGSSPASALFLAQLHNEEQVVLAVTQPDKPAGRNCRLHSTPVKELAQKLSLPYVTPGNLKDDTFRSKLTALRADLGIVIAYGEILPPAVFSAPRAGCVNVHFSLLPAYRGAAPIQWALIKGEHRTGVTTFLIDRGLDTGPVFRQAAVEIAALDDAQTLAEKLNRAGMDVLRETIRDIGRGAQPHPQEGTPGFAPPLRKEHGRISWSKTPEELCNLVRGTRPWPGAFACCKIFGRERLLKISAAAVEQYPGPAAGHREGQIIAVTRLQGLIVRCGNGYLALKSVQMEGKKEMPAWQFWQGSGLAPGDILA